MNLKELLFYKATCGRSSEHDADYTYMLGAYCGPSQQGDDKHVAAEIGATYAVGFLASGTGYRIRNATGVSVQMYPIQLNNASKVRFEVPNDGIKATIFFTNSETLSYGYYAHCVGGDAKPYSSDVPNGTREVDVVDGADSFAFSLYWKNHDITDEIMNSVRVVLIK